MSDAFLRYVELLEDLGSLRFSGKPVELEEDILDAMDVTWNAMTREERERTREERWRAPTRRELEAVLLMREPIDFDREDVARQHAREYFEKAA